MQSPSICLYVCKFRGRVCQRSKTPWILLLSPICWKILKMRTRFIWLRRSALCFWRERNYSMISFVYDIMIIYYTQFFNTQFCCPNIFTQHYAGLLTIYSTTVRCITHLWTIHGFQLMQYKMCINCIYLPPPMFLISTRSIINPITYMFLYILKNIGTLCGFQWTL